MITMRKDMSRKLTRFWRRKRVSGKQGLWYNSMVWATSQDGLCATKRTNPDLQVPLSTLQIEPDLSFDSRRVLKLWGLLIYILTFFLIYPSTRGEY